MKHLFSRPTRLTTAKLSAIIISVIIISTLAIILFVYKGSPQYSSSDSDSPDSNKNVHVSPENTKIVLKTDLSKALHNSAIAGGDFLVRSQNADGSYKYKYYPETDEYSTENNILRHAGVVYSLLLLYEYTHEPKYLESSKKGVDFLMQHLKQTDRDKAYIFDDNDAKLGGAGLAVVALAKLESLEKTGKYFDNIKDLTNFILSMQEDNGKFRSFYIYDGQYGNPKDSHIYPGEAMLALVRAYSLFEDQKYLTSIEKAYDYYSVAFTKGPTTDFTSWTTTAFVELYNIIPERKYADFVFMMADWQTSLQYLDGAPKQEYLGGYGTGGMPSVSAGSHSEGVADAYILAKQLGYGDKVQLYKKSILLAVNFLMKLQYTNENAAKFRDPMEAVGGFYHDFDSSGTRIDYTQHSITAMIKTLTYLPQDEITIEPYLTNHKLPN